MSDAASPDPACSDARVPARSHGVAHQCGCPDRPDHALVRVVAPPEPVSALRARAPHCVPARVAFRLVPYLRRPGVALAQSPAAVPDCAAALPADLVRSFAPARLACWARCGGQVVRCDCRARVDTRAV